MSENRIFIGVAHLNKELISMYYAHCNPPSPTGEDSPFSSHPNNIRLWRVRLWRICRCDEKTVNRSKGYNNVMSSPYICIEFHKNFISWFIFCRFHLVTCYFVLPVEYFSAGRSNGCTKFTNLMWPWHVGKQNYIINLNKTSNIVIYLTY